MFLFKQNHRKSMKSVGVCVAILVAAHVAVGYLLYKRSPKRGKLGRIVKKAKRTATGLVHEIF